MSGNTRPQRYPVGTQFFPRGRTELHKVVDYCVTTNLAGEIVASHYVVTHELCGQMITESRVAETTIAMGRIVELSRNP